MTLAGGEYLECAAILLATGTRYRAEETMVQLAGFDACRAAFSFGPHAFRALDSLAGERILIIGGGDNAFENARFLLERGCEVTIAARSAIRAQRALRDVVEAHVACRILCPAILHELAPYGAGVAAGLRASDGHIISCVVDRIHVLTGYEPNTGFLANCLGSDCFAALRFDETGYLMSDASGRTGCAGLYAAGDICNAAHPCVVTALAQGAQAARTIELDLRTV